MPATQAKISVILEEDNMMLEETVVVGYGVQKKVNLTGAVTAVDAKELADRTSHNLTNMLQGSVPGLNITTSAGNPGSAGSLNIRGVTSINEADPLVLIDGVEGDLSRVNPDDVANISVIKDASGPNPAPTRAGRPRYATAAVSAGKSRQCRRTLKPEATGQSIPWTSSGRRMPESITLAILNTIWPNFSPE